MSSSVAIAVAGVGKVYRSYHRPRHRLQQAVVDRATAVCRYVGMEVSPRRYFTEFWALRDVSFEVKQGECLGILGRNGAGKSTLLEIIAGTVAPTTGVVSAKGPIGALLELGSGFAGEFTGRENVNLSAALLGLSRAEIDRKIPLIEQFAEIGSYIDQPVKTYSSGMKLRLAFSVHVALEPSIMIVDEAMSVGDARFQRKCYRRLEEFKRAGGTILFVTHDMGLVSQICDRAIVLEKGAVFAEGPPSRVIRDYHRLLFGSEDRSGTDVAAKGSRYEPHTGRDRSRETRYGSGGATIEEVGIREGVSIRLHEVCEMVMRVQYNAPIAHGLHYGFIISNIQGIELYGVSSMLFGRSLPAAPEGATFECTLRLRMALTPGTYFLSAALAYADGATSSEFLDYRFDAVQFEVVGQSRCFTTSSVDLRGELDHCLVAETLAVRP